jgi:hypothetical protein
MTRAEIKEHAAEGISICLMAICIGLIIIMGLLIAGYL